MKGWTILHPKELKRGEFDETRQTMVWDLVDDRVETLTAELAYDKFTEPAIVRIEQLATDENLLVVARPRGGANNIVAEPLSLIRITATGDDCPVNSLYFDAAPKAGVSSRLLRSPWPNTTTKNQPPARVTNAAATEDRRSLGNCELTSPKNLSHEGRVVGVCFVKSVPSCLVPRLMGFLQSLPRLPDRVFPPPRLVT